MYQTTNIKTVYNVYYLNRAWIIEVYLLYLGSRYDIVTNIKFGSGFDQLYLHVHTDGGFQLVPPKLSL